MSDYISSNRIAPAYFNRNSIYVHLSNTRLLSNQSRPRNVNREQPRILREGQQCNWIHEDSLPQFFIHLSGHLLVLDIAHLHVGLVLENQFAAILHEHQVYPAQILKLIHFTMINNLTFLPQITQQCSKKLYDIDIKYRLWLLCFEYLLLSLTHMNSTRCLCLQSVDLTSKLCKLDIVWCKIIISWKAKLEDQANSKKE